MILSALFGVIMLTAAAKKNGNTDYHRLTNLVNSFSVAPLIGLPPKGAEFCHTLNILLVGHQHRRALLQLQFNSSVVSHWLVHNEGCRALGGFPPKGKYKNSKN
jgi:hypothetical protein